MKISFTGVTTYNGCSKPGCTEKRCFRHHRAGEHTFVRHFKWQAPGRRYVAFVQRYDEFRPSDVVPVCADHHEEIHDLIEQHDIDWQFEHDCIKAFADFSWAEAEALMESRKAVTAAWLKTKTPGLKVHRITNWK